MVLVGFGTPDIHVLECRRDVEGLIKALGYEKGPHVRHEAAMALGEIGDARAVEVLIAALTDSK
ncbi:MAG: HEAT repeat domain-containing protein [Methanospirillum sp.]